MKIFFDTEFIEDGRTIELISIGMCRADGRKLYYEFRECDHSRASPWVKENVLPKLQGGVALLSREHIARAIVDFAGERPQFWADYAAYDWVALCQLYGTMMDLPKNWPMYCRDLQQFIEAQGFPRAELPAQYEEEHNALSDAMWAFHAWQRVNDHDRYKNS